MNASAPLTEGMFTVAATLVATNSMNFCTSPGDVYCDLCCRKALTYAYMLDTHAHIHVRTYVYMHARTHARTHAHTRIPFAVE